MVETEKIEMKKNKPLLTPRMQGILGIIAIIIMVIFAFIRPAERDPKAPLQITNLIESRSINRTIEYKGVSLHFEKALIASKFSDDRKRDGTYTIRVQIQTKNNGPEQISIPYNSIVSLVLADGTTIQPKLISVLPLEVPGRDQNGFFDFPIEKVVPLSSLTLRFHDQSIAFSS